ncbi:hypothetical protein [Streptomyces sp. NPDC002265]|uniref:hypothetical protein n=1 Tax=Streptomyces sp. NPDC002265 TaxID=3154415 RepID=UPI003317F6A3
MTVVIAGSGQVSGLAKPWQLLARRQPARAGPPGASGPARGLRPLRGSDAADVEDTED